MLGGEAPFRELIDGLRLRFEADPSYARKHPFLTRAQLACLIRGMVFPGSALPQQPSSAGAPPAVQPFDIASHWAKESIEIVLNAGIMDVLPDSMFHPEAKVTKASFYFIVQRIRRTASLNDQDGDDPFPGGFEAILRMQLDVLRDEQPAGGADLSGQEAVSVLDRLKQGWTIPHG